MAVSDRIQEARTRFGQAPCLLLRADQSTGEKPWEIVSERLQPDGPTTRLIDLERERGLHV